MSLNKRESDVSGLTITQPQPTHLATNNSKLLPTIEDVDSAHSMTPTLTPTGTRSADDRDASPFSPFYNHEANGLDAQKLEDKQNGNVYDSDIEACLTESSNNIVHYLPTSKDNSVWPCQKALMEKKKAARRQKGCNPMRNLDRKTKIWVKILIGFFVVGAAVGVGIGVSKAVGGGVWSSDHNSKPLGS